MVESSTPDPAAPVADDRPPDASSSPAPAAAESVPGRRVHPVFARHRFALALIVAFHAGLAVWMAAIRGPYDLYFYDEKFNLENVVQIITSRGLEPANGWYSLLSYLPQALIGLAMEELHQHTGTPWLRAIDPEGQAPMLATYHLAFACRLVGIVYGCLSLWLLFRLGTRLFSPATGLLATAALAVSPWMIRTSAEFKPDSLLLLCTLLAVLLIARFLEQPSLGRYLWVGAGLGLAATAKLNGTFVGPLVALAGIAGALLAEPRGWRAAGRRLLLWGSCAAAVAAAVFFATTPYFRLMLFYAGRIENFYGQKAGLSTPEDVVRQAIADLPTAVFLGPATAVLAVAGALLVLFRLFERGTPAGARLGRLLPLGFPLVYATVLALTMRYYKQNNLVQLLPFLALLAAAALAGLGALAGRLRAIGGGLAALGAAVFLGYSAWLALAFSYDENVPYDWQVLDAQLHGYARLDAPKVIVYEGPYETIPSYAFSRHDGAALKPSVRWIDDASALDREQLDLADVVVLRKDLGGPQRSNFIGALRAAVTPDAVLEIDPHPLAVRGHGFVSIYHAWRFRDDAVADLPCRNTPDPFVFACRLPDGVKAGEVAALHFSFWSKKIGVAEILIGGATGREGARGGPGEEGAGEEGAGEEGAGESGIRVEPLASADLGSGKGWEAMSERFVVPYPGARVELRFEKPIEGRLEDAVPVSVSRWLPPEGVELRIAPPFGKRLSSPVPAPLAEPLLPAAPAAPAALAPAPLEPAAEASLAPADALEPAAAPAPDPAPLKPEEPTISPAATRPESD